MMQPHEIATLFPMMSPEDRAHLRASIERDGQLEEILVFEGKILDGRHRYETCLDLGVEPRLKTFEGGLADAFSYGVALNLSRRHLTTVQRAAAGAGIKEFQTRILLGDTEPDTEDEDEDEPEVEAEPIDVTISEDESPAHEEPEADPQPKKAKKKKKGPSPRTINRKAREIASQQVGVSGRTIDQAVKVKEEAPDVFERMLAGTAGSISDVKKVVALPEEQRQRVHDLVDDGAQIKAALKQVAPPPPPQPGPVFLGKVILEPEQAKSFEAILEQRGIKRAEAGKEALLDWIAKHALEPALAGV